MALYTAGSVRLEVIPDMSKFAAKLRTQARGLNENVKVGIEIDQSRLRGLQSDLNKVSRNQTIKVNVDIDTSKFSQLGALAAGAASKVGLITGAAVAAGASVAALPGLLVGAAAGAGVLALSFRGVGDALKASSEGADKFAAAMAKLPAPAQALVVQLLAMKPLVEKLQATSAQAFLPGLTQMLKDSVSLFPVVNGFLRETGTLLGDTARKFGSLFKSEEFRNNLKDTFDASLPVLRAFADGVLKLIDAWFKLGAESGPIMKSLATLISDVFTGLSDFVTGLAPHISGFGAVFEALGIILKDLLPVLGSALALVSGILGWLGPELIAGIVAGLAGLLIGFKIAEGIYAMVTAAKLLWVVLSANPVGVVITLLAALAAALIYAYQHSEAFRNVVDAAFRAIAAAGQWLWGQLKVSFGWMMDGFRAVGDSITWVWEHVIKPAWDALVGGLNWVRTNFQNTVDWIGRIWSGLKSILAKPINFLINTVWNGGILAAWNAVARLLGIGEIAPLRAIPEFAQGGPVTGGTPGKDSVLAALMPGEYVLPTRLAQQLGYDNLDRIRKESLGGGRVSSEGMLQGYAQGGRIPEAKAFIQSQLGKPYQWGGIGNPSWDCSGLASGVQNTLLGRNPRQRLYTTSAFGPNRGAAGLVPFGRGAQGSAFTVGVQPGHMAGTLDGLNFESSGGVGVHAGSSARGTGSFPWHFFLPSVGGQFVDGGGGFFDWLGDMLGKIASGLAGPMHALVNTIPFDRPPEYRAIPKALGHKVIDTLVGFATGKARSDPRAAMGGDGPISYGIGPVADQVRAVAQSFGWGDGPQWAAIQRLVQKESGWNPTARNPTSTAFGLFQFLDSTWAAMGGRKTDNPSYQATLGLRYIKGKYRDPLGALAFHNSHNWYDSGGWLPPGASAAVNGTGAPEAVLTSQQWNTVSSLAAQGASGSGTVIHVYAQPGQDTEAIAMSVKRRLDFAGRTG